MYGDMIVGAIFSCKMTVFLLHQFSLNCVHKAGLKQKHRVFEDGQDQSHKCCSNFNFFFFF